MSPTLFICHTAYHVMISVCRAFGQSPAPDIILSTTIPQANALAGRLSASGLFGNVSVFDEAACGSSKQRGFFATLVFGHFFGRRHVERYGKLTLPKGHYSAIYIYNDWSVLGRYLQDKNLPYIMCEDTFARSCSAVQPYIEKQHQQAYFGLRQAVGYGYLYWGEWKGVVAVETENLAETNFVCNKLVEHSKADLMQNLTASQKQAVCSIFITTELPQAADNAVLFLPRDFAGEHLLPADEQTAIFKAVVAQYCADGQLFIKAHPRDASDYSLLYPQAIVLDRTMPSEVLNYALNFRFRRAVAVESMVLKALQVADEKILLSLQEAKALL